MTVRRVTSYGMVDVAVVAPPPYQLAVPTRITEVSGGRCALIVSHRPKRAISEGRVLTVSCVWCSRKRDR